MSTTLLQIDEQVHEETTLGYTEQQIDEYCEKVLNLYLTCHSDGKTLFEGVQIIKQLIGECPKYSKSHNVEQFYD